MTRPRQWTSIEELSHDDAITDWLASEYPIAATFEPTARRQFLKLMAASFVGILPVMIVIIFLQRYLVAGLTAGAVKQ